MDSRETRTELDQGEGAAVRSQKEAEERAQSPWGQHGRRRMAKGKNTDDGSRVKVGGKSSNVSGTNFAFPASSLDRPFHYKTPLGWGAWVRTSSRGEGQELWEPVWRQEERRASSQGKRELP